MAEQTQKLSNAINIAADDLQNLMVSRRLDALRKTLKEFGVLTGEYSIGRIADDAVCLWNNQGTWTTCYCERGNTEHVSEFSTLNAACEDVIDRTGDLDEVDSMLSKYHEYCASDTDVKYADIKTILKRAFTSVAML